MLFHTIEIHIQMLSVEFLSTYYDRLMLILKAETKIGNSKAS